MLERDGDAAVEAVDVAVLLRDRKVNTEWRLPATEIMSSYDTVREDCESAASDIEVKVEGVVVRESTEDWLEEAGWLFLWKANMADTLRIGK